MTQFRQRLPKGRQEWALNSTIGGGYQLLLAEPEPGITRRLDSVWATTFDGQPMTHAFALTVTGAPANAFEFWRATVAAWTVDRMPSHPNVSIHAGSGWGLYQVNGLELRTQIIAGTAPVNAYVGVNYVEY